MCSVLGVILWGFSQKEKGFAFSADLVGVPSGQYSQPTLRQKNMANRSSSVRLLLQTVKSRKVQRLAFQRCLNRVSKSGRCKISLS